jgi:Ti-type conjugative transfer relaxase TraA
MYHFRVKVIGRSSGRSAAGATAYRAGGRSSASGLAYRVGGVLSDPLTGQSYDYRAKGRIDRDGFGVLHVEVVAPQGARPWVFDLQSLLNRVEAAEKRKDAQLFRELEISLPRELSPEDHRALVKAFVEQHCVREGMVAVIAHHNERAADGGANPHVHVLLTMRALTPEGFGNKVREWNNRERVGEWREAWAVLANEFLKARGHEPRLDHRSFKERDISLEPDIYVGPAKGRAFDGIIIEQRSRDRAASRERNSARMMRNPEWVLDQLSRMQATFTESDIAAFLYRHGGLGPDDERSVTLKSRILASPQLMRIASDLKGPARYTTRAMVECEVRLARSAEALARRPAEEGIAVDVSALSPEQARAARYVVSGPDLTAIEGIAGAGKTHLLSAVRRALAARGYRVRGAALSKVVARSLGESVDIPTQTVHSLLKDLAREKPFAPLEKGDVLILDEAGLIGSRQMEAVLRHAERAGAKVVLVGDRRQLQAIEAGAAFRAIVERHGAAKLSEVRRQNHEWQRVATRDFARGRVGVALDAYRARGSVHAHRTPGEAMSALAQRWINDRSAGGGSQIVLAHRKRDAAKLNAVIREALREEGALGEDFSVPVIVSEEVAGELKEFIEFRTFAAGDRILFTRNDRALGVENGAVGTIAAVTDAGVMRIVMPDGKTKWVDPRVYAYLEQGYAMTIHKAQGMTVDRAYVYASRGLDAHASYVAMTRHRERVDLYCDCHEFEKDEELTAILGRERQKDSTLDYQRETPSPFPSSVLAIDRFKNAAEERQARARAALAAERETLRDRGPERD